MYGILYEVDTTGGSTSYLPLYQTDNYTIQPSDRDNWVTIGFDQAYNLVPGMYLRFWFWIILEIIHDFFYLSRSVTTQSRVSVVVQILLLTEAY